MTEAYTICKGVEVEKGKFDTFAHDAIVSVIEHAKSLWDFAERTDDFCIQNIGQSIVFGGTNRVVWHPAYGWRCDRQYCTPRFISIFETWQKHGFPRYL